MNCTNCGAVLSEDEMFCTNCGTQVPAASAEPVAEDVPAAPAIIGVPEKKPMSKEELPSQFRVMSPWAYFGLEILYTIPVVGFIFLIIHSFSSKNLNRRSFARSYWCALLIVGGIALVAVILGAILGVSIFSQLKGGIPANMFR